MNTSVPSIPFVDGKHIPQFGLGVFQTPPAQTAKAVATAFEAGYRHIDTAAIYGNEAGVGQAIAASGIPREELFITTKLWNDEQGYDKTLKACDASLNKLRLDYVDLYLIHWPCPAKNLIVETWRAFIELQRRGRVKSIGVSNFRVHELQRLIDETGVKPVANQIELHPLLQQNELRAFHAEQHIITESWSPLAPRVRPSLLEDAALKTIAGKHGKSVAQVILRWHIELGLVVFPKSATPARIKENIAIFDFRLDQDDLAAIAKLNANRRSGPDPANI